MARVAVSSSSGLRPSDLSGHLCPNDCVGATVDLELVWNIADTLNADGSAQPDCAGPFVRRGGQMYQGVFCQGKISGRTEINWKQESHGTGRCSMGFFDSWRRKIVQRRKGKIAQTFTIYRLRNQRGYSIIERVKSRTFVTDGSGRTTGSKSIVAADRLGSSIFTQRELDCFS